MIKSIKFPLFAVVFVGLIGGFLIAWSSWKYIIVNIIVMFFDPSCDKGTIGCNVIFFPIYTIFVITIIMWAFLRIRH